MDAPPGRVMSSIGVRRAGVVAGSLAFAALLGASAAFRWDAVGRVSAELRLHGVVPEALVGAAPAALCIMEVLIAATLCLGAASRAAARLGVSLLVAFLSSATAYLVLVAVTRGTHLSCGCAGKVDLDIASAMWRNAGLLCSAFGLAWLGDGSDLHSAAGPDLRGRRA